MTVHEKVLTSFHRSAAFDPWLARPSAGMVGEAPTFFSAGAEIYAQGERAAAFIPLSLVRCAFIAS